MNNESAFLDAIAQSPDDDALRLVYADWLEERGDTRAEYLRLEVQLANATPGTKADTPEYITRQNLAGRLDPMRFKINPAWVDTAGRRYNVVLRRCEYEEDRRKITRRLRRLLDGERGRASKLVASSPCIVLPGLPFWSAVRAAWKVLGRNWTHDSLPPLSGLESALASPVISPSPALVGDLPATDFTSEKEVADAMLAEAVWLGMTLDEFLRPTNAKNPLLRRALHWFEEHESC